MSGQHKSEINNYMRRCLQGLLSEISDKIIIVCYLRRQDLFIESQYNQYCKNPWYGDPRVPLPSFKEFVRCKPIELNYFSVLEEWAKIFNDAEFIIAPYEKESFQHDMETDFYTKILKLNVQEVEKFESIERNQTNLRLDRDVLEYKFQLGVKSSVAAQLLRKYSEQMQTVKDYAYFTLEERKQFMEPFISQNEKVARKYLHQIDGKLFQNMSYDIPAYGGLGNDKIMEITRYLVEEMDK